MYHLTKIVILCLAFTFSGGLKAQTLNGLLNSQIKTEQELLTIMNNGTFADQQIMQLGNQNSAQINAKGVQLNQVGNQQQFYYNGTSFLPSNMKINVEGNSNYVEVMGDNSILNNATINIRGNYRSVIIRNYK